MLLAQTRHGNFANQDIELCQSGIVKRTKQIQKSQFQALSFRVTSACNDYSTKAKFSDPAFLPTPYVPVCVRAAMGWLMKQSW